MNAIRVKNKIQIFSRKALLVTAVAICTLAVNPLAQISTANADAKTSINPACGKRFAGSYLTTITGNIAGNNYFSRGVVTLTQDGNFFVIDSNQSGAQGQFAPFSDIQGVWKCQGKNEITARGINFALPSSLGPGGIGRVDYQASFNSNADNIEGTIELRLFDLQADPLVDAPAATTFNFSGKRITAH